MLAVGCFILGLAAVAALPTDQVLRKTEGLRYQYVEGPDGKLHLADLWLKTSDLPDVARYNPDAHNVYHLFTRLNPIISQPLLLENGVLHGLSNYSPRRRTIFLIHGWLDSAVSQFNAVLVPAFLAAEDVNIVVVDWYAGGGTINYAAAVANTVTSGQAVARFITALNQASGANPAQYHIVGHSLGGHQSGIVGRNLGGGVAYITALDPALPGWLNNDEAFSPADGRYTEVIHTNAGFLGALVPLGQVDFYPNGGSGMPGCDSNDCDHGRSFHYMGESLVTGGFTGRACATYLAALTGNCLLPGSLRMGGLVPKTGSTGVYYLQTNAAPPFSRG